MTLTKAELTQGLIENLGFTRHEAKLLVNNFFEIITHSLCSGEEVKISGFGSFLLRDKNPRPGRNPRTGEEVIIAQRRVVTFRQGERLKQGLHQSLEIA